MVRNKPGQHFGKKIIAYGHSFDSEKEKYFYERFLLYTSYQVKVHEVFRVMDKFMVGGSNIRGTIYTPDFTVYDKSGALRHVYDVKNGFTSYAIDNGAKLRFKLFALKYGIPVECVVPRKHDFKMKILGLTKPDLQERHEQIKKNKNGAIKSRKNVYYDVMDNVHYDVGDIIGK